MPVLNELKKQFLTEFDYRGEARNLEEVARNVLPVWGGCVAMPEPVPELVSEHVLTMSFLPGEKLELALKREWAGALGGAQGADLVDAVVAGGVGGGAGGGAGIWRCVRASPGSTAGGEQYHAKNGYPSEDGQGFFVSRIQGVKAA